MIALLQRVSQADVTVDQEIVGQIGHGWLVFLGVGKEDTDEEAKWLADRVLGLRAMADDQGKMNKSVVDVNGSLLVVSQFTLMADCRTGRRPSFTLAAGPEHAKRLYELFVIVLRDSGLPVETGVFGADMAVRLINDGPVTFWLDSRSR